MDTVGTPFRKDIEGLRGVAVLLVIFFHVGWHRFAGGFVGVDVFFVISGYLIAQQLFRESQRAGRLDLARFWARRLRRLVPLLFLTIAATLAASVLVYSPLGWTALANEAGSSTLYVSNVWFARHGQAYFQSATSPFLHTWSLGVEEQFYVGWPLVIVAVVALARWTRRALRGVFLAAVVLLSVMSFVVGVHFTNRGSPWAFYSAPTRAWEFGLGAIAFLVGPTVSRCRAWIGIGLGWLCVGAVCFAALAFDEFTAMPGTAALVPCVGAALLMAGGDVQRNRLAVGRVLAMRPLRSLGRVSYAWYLFHWPAIVLTAAATNRHDIPTLSAAASASLLLSYPATRWIEQPIRRARLLDSNSRTYVLAAAVSSLSLVGVVALRWEATRQLHDPFLSHLAAVRDARSTTGAVGCEDREVAENVRACVYGPDGANGIVMLIGDSHAAQWADALVRATSTMGYRLIVRTYGGCPALDVFVARTGFREASPACLAFRAETSRILAAARPDVVVTSNADYSGLLLRDANGPLLNTDETRDAYASARKQFARLVLDSGSRLAVIEDNPAQTEDPIECLARERDAAPCSVRSSRVVPALEAFAAVEAATFREVAPVATMSPVPLICGTERCVVEQGGIIVYADATHLSAEFTVSKVDAVQAMLSDAVR